MILTITLNPSVDITYKLDDLKIGNINRATNYVKTPGGKGINVSKVLKQLGNEVGATGFLGGTNGDYIKNGINELDIKDYFYSIGENTRNCIAVMDRGVQTEILEAGPRIDEKIASEFLKEFEELLDKKDIKLVVASGSLPVGLPKDYYKKLIEIAENKGAKFILDTSKDYLKEALNSSIYLIKPNIEELEELLDVKINTEEDLKKILLEMKSLDIKIIVVSLGSKGAIALCDGELYKVTIPKVEVKSPVGSGDSLVAGLASEISKNSTYEEILRVGNTCGVLNAMNLETGKINLEDFKKIHDEIKVTKL